MNIIACSSGMCETDDFFLSGAAGQLTSSLKVSAELLNAVRKGSVETSV